MLLQLGTKFAASRDDSKSWASLLFALGPLAQLHLLRRRRDAVHASDRPMTPPGACRGPRISRQGEEERRRGTDGPATAPTNARRDDRLQDSCGTCPRPTRRRPSGATGGSPQEQGSNPQEPGKRPGAGPAPTPTPARRPASPTTTRATAGPSRRPASSAQPRRRAANAAPTTSSLCGHGSPASRVAASYKRLAALRVNDDDPPPPRGGRARWTTSTTRGGAVPNTA